MWTGLAGDGDHSEVDRRHTILTQSNPPSRSFDHNELSVMQFYTPLTVIVGHNGSGKTVSRYHSLPHITEPLIAES